MLEQGEQIVFYGTTSNYLTSMYVTPFWNTNVEEFVIQIVLPRKRYKRYKFKNYNLPMLKMPKTSNKHTNWLIKIQFSRSSMAVYTFVSNPVSCDNQEQRLQSQPQLKVVGWVRLK